MGQRRRTTFPETSCSGGCGRLPFINMIDGKKIRKLREQRDWNIARLASEAGVRQETAERWEDGIHAPKGASLLTLCRALNCSEQDLSK